MPELATTTSFDPVGEGKVPGPTDRADNLGVNPEARGRWPRQLNLGDEVEGRLAAWLDEEIRHAYAERAPLLDDWKRWQTDYWALPSSPEKNFPFKRSANIVIPLTAIAVEAIYSRLMNMLAASDPLWSIRPRTPAWIPAAKPVERWLQGEVENENALNVRHFAKSAFLEFVKLGTAVGKSGYVREVRKSVRNEGGVERDYYAEVRNGATLDYVPVANFLFRMGEQDPQQAPWVGEEHDFSWSQLKRMSLSGQYIPGAVEKVRDFWANSQAAQSGSGTDYKEVLDKLSNTEPIWHKTFKVKEIWCSFDVDGDGIDEEIVVDFHQESRTFLAIRYNWYADLHRPYRVGQFIPVEGRLPGIGVGKQNEQFQKEITTIHRQRLDNATLANMGMIRVKKMSGISPDEPIFPGKIWFVDDHNDVAPFKLSEIYPSSYANEESINRYSEKATSVNEVVLGMPQQGTPGTATSDLTRLAEGNQKIDFVIDNVRSWMGQLGQDVLANYQQFGDQGRHWLMQEENGGFVEAILTMPQELVMHGAAISVKLTDSSTNRHVEQQQFMSLFQVITNYYGTVLQYAMQLGDPQTMQELGMGALRASDEALRNLLNTFEGVDVDKLLLTPTLVQQQNNPQQGALPPGGMGAENQGGPTGGPAQPQEQAGMEGLLATLGATGNGGGNGGGPSRF